MYVLVFMVVIVVYGRFELLVGAIDECETACQSS